MGRKKKENAVEQVAYQPVNYGNRFFVDSREMRSPYMQSYYAARTAAPLEPAVAPPPVAAPVSDKPVKAAPVEKPNKAKDVKINGKQKKVKRNFFVAITALFTILLIAFFALSFVGIEKISEYTSFAVYKTKEVDEEGNAVIGKVSLKDIVMGTVQSFKKKEAPASAAEGETTTTESTEAEAEKESYFYYENRMENVKELDIVGKISAYGLPVAIAVLALVAVIFLIRLLVALFTPKRRKFFILSGIVMLILGIAINLFMFMWAAGTEFAKFGQFYSIIAKESELPLQGGIGALVVVAIPLLITITSIFCFRSKKKLGK